jgi:hypothetical protein
MHYEFTQIGGAADYRAEMTALLASINLAGQINARMIAAASSGWTLTRVSAQPIYPTRLKAVFLDIGTVGAKSGTQAPSNVAATVTKTTDLATRYGVGSWHQGGLIASDVQGGSIAAGLRVELAALGSELSDVVDGTNPGTFVPVIWNLITPVRRTDIQGYIVQDTSRVMRRRTLRLGV